MSRSRPSDDVRPYSSKADVEGLGVPLLFCFLGLSNQDINGFGQIFFVISGNFLAPIDGYTNLPFRILCQRYGAGSSCVPLVSAASLVMNKKAIGNVDIHPDERRVGIQLVGSDISQMALASRMVVERFPVVSFLNINAGCPSARTRGCGGGSALLDTPGKIFEMVRSMKKAVGVPVSVKIRVKEDAPKTVAICKGIEEAGADFIIIHGRTAAQGYSGKADWGLVKAVKDEVGIQIVGNGDIQDIAQGEGLVREGYCDSYMIGRAAMANPLVFSGKKTETAEERFGLFEEYLSLQRRYLGEPIVSDAKAKAVNLLRGMPNVAMLRDRICRAGTVDEMLDLKDMALSR
jgi:tRNA-dihydrouridine synthase B